MTPAALADEATELAQRAQMLAAHAHEVAHSTMTAIAPVGAAVEPIVFLLAVFLLACFVGYYVVWNVTPALHSPLMAVTNAISSVIIVGAMLAAGLGDSVAAKICGFIAVTLASVNIFGGFTVTQRMLSMFRAKTPAKKTK
jgi:H+-translocating NAD(P) transhydrogenase subunit alpha